MSLIADVIKYEGDNNTVVYKHEVEDFNSKTQVIVHDSQEAVFFHNGQALDSLRGGKHTLETENVPLLRKVFNMITGGVKPFHAEIYFVNLVDKMEIRWGTNEHFTYIDPVNNNTPFSLGAKGSFTFRVDNARKLLIKLVGTESYLSNEVLASYFKSRMMTKIKSYLPQVLKEKGVSVFELDEHLAEFSEKLHAILNGDFEEYGIKLVSFWIDDFVKPENDPIYRKIRDLKGLDLTGEWEAKTRKKIALVQESAEVEKKMMNIDLEKYRQETLGYTYQQERQFDVLEEMAKNEGAGADTRNGILGMGMGLGMMGATANISGKMMNDAYSNLMTPANQQQVVQPNNDSRSGSIPGLVELKEDTNETPTSKTDADSFQLKVRQLKMLRDEGILSEEEFEEEKRKLLKEIRGGSI